ncbi:MAG: hypothetical protein U0X75_22555 [Acidobacteriota bacterium]
MVLSVTALIVGHVIIGPSLSFTVTVKLHEGPAVVEQLTVVVPTGRTNPMSNTVPQPEGVGGDK